jgi:DNA-binding protein HU-beta
MAAKIEIRSPEAGQYTWVITSQGRTLASGGTYARKALAEKAVEALRKAAVSATIDDQTAQRARAAAKTTKAAAKRTPATKKAAGAAGRASKAGSSAKKTAGATSKKATGAKRGRR